jgi:hypothetical protein
VGSLVQWTVSLAYPRGAAVPPVSRALVIFSDVIKLGRLTWNPRQSRVVAIAHALTLLRARWLRTEPLLPRSMRTGLFRLAWHSRCPVSPAPPVCRGSEREREPHPIANPHRSRLPVFRGPSWCCRELGVAAAPCAVSRGEGARRPPFTGARQSAQRPPVRFKCSMLPFFSSLFSVKSGSRLPKP